MHLKIVIASKIFKSIDFTIDIRGSHGFYTLKQYQFKMCLVCKHDFVLIPYMLKNVISRLVAKLPFIFFPKYLISINRSNFAKTIQKTMLSKSLETQLKARIRINSI